MVPPPSAASSTPLPPGGPGFVYRLLHRVPVDAVDRFLALEARLMAAVRPYPGYLGESGPRYVGQIAGASLALYESTLRFESLQSFLGWMDSPERRAILDPAEREGYRFEGAAELEGYSRWLAAAVRRPVPIWKTNLLVLLVLYPTVMLLSALLRGLPLDGPSKVLLGNVGSVALTGWLLVPWVSRLYASWAEGLGSNRGRALALASIAGWLVLMLQGFRALPSAFW